MPALRVGLVLDSLTPPRWVRRVVEQIQASSYARIVVVVVDEPVRRSGRRRHTAWGRELLYQLYTRLDDRLFGRPGDALDRCSITNLLSGVPVLASPVLESECGGWPPAMRARLLECSLDVVLALGRRPADSEARGLARYGVWFLHHGHDLATAGAPPGFWEVLEGHRATGSLLAVTGCGAPVPRIVSRSYAPTDNRSVRRNRNNYYWKTADFLLRKLDEVHSDPSSGLAEVFEPAPTTMPARYRRAPTNAEMTRLLGSLARRYLVEKLAHVIWLDQWFVAVSADGRTDTGTSEARRFTYLLPPADRYWADPFPITHNGRQYIFLEEFLLGRGKAHIAVSTIQPDGRPTRPVTVLDRPYHLSYPFVFTWRDTYYMMPETGRNRTVELYRASSFPFEWELDRVLLDNINAADATLVEIQGTWWLFVNVAVDGSGNADELHLFSAPEPIGPWLPHVRNPVKSDARSARPAGRILTVGDAYYRPSQDCSGRYGRAVVLNQIVSLDHAHYVEREVGKIEPEPAGGLLGTHTLNQCGQFVCLDGVLRASRFRVWRKGARLATGVAALNGDHLSAARVRAAGRSAIGFWASGQAASVLGSRS